MLPCACVLAWQFLDMAEHRGAVSSGHGAEGSSQQDSQFELFSIMMHTGSALAGHYFAYIKVWTVLLSPLLLLFLHTCGSQWR